MLMGFLQNEFCSQSVDNWGCLQKISTLKTEKVCRQSVKFVQFVLQIGRHGIDVYRRRLIIPSCDWQAIKRAADTCSSHLQTERCRHRTEV